MLALRQFLTIQTCLRVGICAIFVGGFAASLEATQLPIAAKGSINNKYGQNNTLLLSGNWYQPCTVDATCVTTGNSGFISASACPPNTSGSAPAQGGNGSPYANPNTSAPTAFQGSCGFAFTGSLTPLGSKNGWHSYTPSQGQTSSSMQTYLNGLSSGNTTNPLSFNLTSAASLNWYNSGEASTSKPYRHPPGDYGTFLSTANTNTTPGITICVGSNVAHCTTANPTTGISEIAFYWGSVDPWNQIGFCQTSGSCVYVYGSDLSGFTFNQTSYGVGAGNINGAVVDIQNQTLTPWAYITFSSCNNASTPNCKPAFEIDNLTYATSGCNSCAVINGAAFDPTAPVPEPTSAFLLAGSAAVALKRLRRKA